MFLKFKPFEASSRLEFKDPDTGFLYQAKSLPSLYKEIIQYRHNNRLEDIENLQDVVENYLCTLPENCNKCSPKELHRSFMTYVRGGVQLVKNFAYKKYATQEVAEKRAAQCEKCPLNVFPDKGPFLNYVDEWAIKFVGDRKTSNADKLGNCAGCTCVLRAKVFVGDALPPFPDDQLVKLRGVRCWQLKLSGQDK
jgi:hypothetical protein